MYNVLVIGSGTQGYVTVRSLKKAGHRVYLLFSGRHNYADDSRYVDVKIEIKEKSETKEYLDAVVSTIRQHHIDAVIPMGDLPARFLSKNKEQLLKITHFVMPDIEAFEKGYDKNSLMTLCAEKGYPHPQTINDVESVLQLDKDKLQFPLLIKPNHTCGGRGMTLVRSYEELKQKFERVYNEFGPCHLQRYIRQGGAQVEVQIYINEQQELVASSVIYKYRWYPENGGSSCCATSVKNDEVVNMCYRLLKDIGWVGFADFDLIEDPDEGNLKVMELNPRVPACVKAAVASGTDWPNIILNAYMHQPIPQPSFKQGVILKHLGMEALWFFYSKNRFKSKPCILKLMGKNIYYQDLDISDPLPFLEGSWHNVKQQMNPTFRKSKSGTR